MKAHCERCAKKGLICETPTYSAARSSALTDPPYPDFTVSSTERPRLPPLKHLPPLSSLARELESQFPGEDIFQINTRAQRVLDTLRLQDTTNKTTASIPPRQTTFAPRTPTPPRIWEGPLDTTTKTAALDSVQLLFNPGGPTGRIFPPTWPPKQSDSQLSIKGASKLTSIMSLKCRSNTRRVCMASKRKTQRIPIWRC